ncbi:MAG TPA: hypothetical protein VGI92_04725 [Gemmatimonadales bacterium]|jgi:hypothetical protein
MRWRGFALAELLVALLISGIIGIALTKLVINQSRFVSTQDGIMRARSGARAALNVLASEVRMVSDSGLRSASSDSIVIRVPYAFGIACIWGLGYTAIAPFPSDSASVAIAAPSGVAWRDSVGSWHFIEPATVITGIPTTFCNAVGIHVMNSTKWTATSWAVSGTTSTAPSQFAPVYLYQTITYAFGPSVDMPGRRALWRAVPSAGLREEMVTPFDSSAKFMFIVGNAQAVQASPPAVLDSVVGVRVRLVAASDNAPGGRTAPMIFNLSTNLLFRNRVY